MIGYYKGYQIEASHCGAFIVMLKNQKKVGFCVVTEYVFIKDAIYLQRQ